MNILAEIEAAERFAALAQRELTRCESEVEFLYGIKIPCTVEWTTKGHTAGWCRYPHPGQAASRLCFNARLAAQEGDGFRETIAHEYAHAVIFERYWRAGDRVPHHGREWQDLMQILGFAGDRCHRYSTISAASQRRLEREQLRGLK